MRYYYRTKEEHRPTRRRVFAAAVIFLIAAVLFLGVLIYNNSAARDEPVEGESFSLADFQAVLAVKEFSSDRRVGAISGVKDAAGKAEAVWLEIYGEAVEDEKPYVVSRDSENGVWFVTGSLPRDFWGRSVMGGTACILIRDDGKVLAVWHEK